ncbi:unnamed protein product [Urochloa decumbens]|uniref:Uncharacterized protein n=1 Tax=Urochloa decumbens TaxID=240449 RepID=A0ABC9A5D6_9POAL
MAVLPRLPRLLALAWLAVALLLAATSGCLCRPHVTPTPPLTPPAPPAGDAPPAHHVPVPATPWRPIHPRPICRGAFCTPRLPPIRICPPEGCSGQGPP